MVPIEVAYSRQRSVRALLPRGCDRRGSVRSDCRFWKLGGHQYRPQDILVLMIVTPQNGPSSKPTNFHVQVFHEISWDCLQRCLERDAWGWEAVSSVEEASCIVPHSSSHQHLLRIILFPHCDPSNNSYTATMCRHIKVTLSPTDYRSRHPERKNYFQRSRKKPPK